MPKPVQKVRSMLNRLRDTLFKGVFRARFRYDVFISYNHRAKGYAVNLKKQLADLDFSCFIDQEEAPPGSSLDPTLEKALSKSAVLVLLATERALTRPYIALEFQKFVSTGRRIIPINISGALTENDEDALARTPWDIIKSRKLIWIDEADEAFAKEIPSPPIADGIDKLFKYTRRNSRVRTEIIGTAVLVLLLAVGAGFVIKGKAAEVSRQAGLADVAKKDAEKQLGIATEAGKEAQKQLGLAEVATSEAKRQGQIAETAKKEAEHQQEIARTATAEADKQLAIANAAKAEAERQQAIANAQMVRSRHLLYDSDMNLAQSAYETGDMDRVAQLLDAHFRVPANQADLRGFDWFYLWRLSNNEQKRQEGYAGPMAFSPNGRTLAFEGSDHTLKLQDTITHEDKVVPGLTGPLHAVLFSPDAKFLITDGEDQVIKVWDLDANPPKSIATLRESQPEPVTRAERRAAMRREPGVKDIPAVFSGDGKTLAVWSDDTVRLWDTAVWREQTPPKLNLTAAINAVRLSPDANIMVIGHGDRVEFWDLRGGVPKELEALKKQGPNVAAIIAFSPDSKALVTENEDHEVRLWDLSTNIPRERALLEKARWHLFGAFSPDGKRLILVDYDGTAELWDTTTDKPGQAKTLSVDLGKDANAYPAVTLSPDGNMLAIDKGNGTIKLLSLKLNDSSQLAGELATLRIPGGGSVKFSPDNNSLAALNQNGTMKVWDLGRGKEIGLLKGHASSISDFDFSPDGKTLLAVSNDKTLKSWDMTANLLSPVSYLVDFYLLCEAFSPNGKSLAVGGSDGTRILETSGVKDSMLLKRTREDHVHAVAFSPDGDTLAIGGGSGVKLWQASKPAEEPKSLNGKTGIVIAVTFSPDGVLLAAVHANGEVEIWDRSNLLQTPKIMEVPSVTSTAAFSSDHKTLITSGRDGELRLWDIEGLKEPRTLAKNIRALSLSPDGKTMLALSKAGEVKFWDTNRLVEQQTIDLNSSDIGAVALSNDGKVLATAGAGTVTLRDVSTGQVLASLNVPGDWHNFPVSSLAFSFDGKMLVAGTRAGLTFWYAATKEEVIGSPRIKD